MTALYKIPPKTAPNRNFSPRLGQHITSTIKDLTQLMQIPKLNVVGSIPIARSNSFSVLSHFIGGSLYKIRAALYKVCLATVLAGAPSAASAEPPGVVDRARVVVVDGDSVTLDGQEWRLMGFDTPEIEKAGCEGERRLALAAKRRLEDMIAAAREIRLDGGEERDRYKRPLGDLVLDGVNVREAMISEGWARPYNGGRRKGWCSRDSIDTLVPGDPPLKRKGT